MRWKSGHKTPGSLLLCYVDHHDKAYAWAEHRKLETHPKTGAAQLVEIRETIKEVVVPIYVQQELPAPKITAKPALFATRSDDELLSYGVPSEWIGDVKQADEDSLLVLADRLPGEAAEALLELATGGQPRVVQPAASIASPFDHPDARRRFRIISNVEELQRALEYPWEKWTVFLHPDQRETVERDYSGPARVSGSAGTGKTIVALHRAVHLARAHPESRILLATFSETLAHALQTKLRRLIGNEPRLGERIEVNALTPVALRLHQALIGPVRLITSEDLGDLIRSAGTSVQGHKFSLHFLNSEWEQVVDAWQLTDWESYRDVARLGRKTRLPEAQRRVLWSIFDLVRDSLAERRWSTPSSVFAALASHLGSNRKAPFESAVIDEAQDVSVAQLRFLAALGAEQG